jgi:hypothetical protein
MQEYVINTFPNYGFIQSEFSDEDLVFVKNEILELEDIKEEMSSCGRRVIANNYNLFKSKAQVQKLLLPYVFAYLKTFGYEEEINYLTNKAPLVLEDLKANFLDRHESEFPRKQDGIFCFVIWINLGIKSPPSFVKPTEDKTSNFSLYYTDVLGKLKEYIIPVNEHWENNFILFPCELQYGVRPCYVNDSYRTSITGTFKFEV